MLSARAIGDLSKAVKWAEAEQKQLPFSLSQALNKTSFEVREGLNKGTIGAFNRPVKFTQKAFLVKKSTKKNLKTSTYAIDAKGKDRARYLRFGIAGGTRPQKGFEKYFEKAIPNDGTIPTGSYFAPGPHVKINAAGNITRATLKRISKGINAGNFFIGTPRNNNFPPGIYRRRHEALEPYFIATTNKPNYSPRFPIEKIGDKIVERRFMLHASKFLKKNVDDQLRGL